MKGEAHCRDCGDVLMFIRSQGGKWLALDPDPNAIGDVAIDERDRGIILGPGDVLIEDDGRRYIRHSQTCRARARRFRQGLG